MSIGKTRKQQRERMSQVLLVIKLVLFMSMKKKIKVFPICQNLETS
jgi:hypothetical protein